MKTRIAVLALAASLLACNTKPVETEKPPAFDRPGAEQMLTRLLQAVEQNNVAGVEENLFPRNANTLAACGKTRLATNRTAALIKDDDSPGAAAPHVTGVTFSSVEPRGNAYLATYQAQGNSAFAGQEMFVFANGRWWIKCQM